MQKFETLRQPILGELAMSRKKERKRERAAGGIQIKISCQPSFTTIISPETAGREKK